MPQPGNPAYRADSHTDANPCHKTLWNRKLHNHAQPGKPPKPILCKIFIPFLFAI